MGRGGRGGRSRRNMTKKEKEEAERKRKQRFSYLRKIGGGLLTFTILSSIIGGPDNNMIFSDLSSTEKLLVILINILIIFLIYHFIFKPDYTDLKKYLKKIFKNK